MGRPAGRVEQWQRRVLLGLCCSLCYHGRLNQSGATAGASFSSKRLSKPLAEGPTDEAGELAPVEKPQASSPRLRLRVSCCSGLVKRLPEALLALDRRLGLQWEPEIVEMAILLSTLSLQLADAD